MAVWVVLRVARWLFGHRKIDTSPPPGRSHLTTSVGRDHGRSVGRDPLTTSNTPDSFPGGGNVMGGIGGRIPLDVWKKDIGSQDGLNRLEDNFRGKLACFGCKNVIKSSFPRKQTASPEESFCSNQNHSSETNDGTISLESTILRTHQLYCF